MRYIYIWVADRRAWEDVNRRMRAISFIFLVTSAPFS
jgi:hypothetical protein